ncbi:MAG: DUF4340 domain-containing protein, partial [Planctomycetota bacterium]
QRLSIETADGGKLGQLLLGGETREGEIYAKRADFPPVFTVSRATYLRNLLVGRPALRDRTIASFKAADARRITLRTGDSIYRCRRPDSDGRWRLLRPVRGPADTPTIDGILSALEPLRAAGYPVGDADHGLEEPARRLTVGYGDSGQSATLLVGAPCEGPFDGHYARLEGQANTFVLPTPIDRHLQRGLASRRVSALRGLRRLTFSTGDSSRTFRYNPDEGAWTDADGNALPDSLQKKVQMAADLIRNFRAERVAAYSLDDAARYGFDSPHLAVTIAQQKMRGKSIIVGGRTENGGRYVRGPASSFVLGADEGDIETLRAPLRDR